MKKFVKTLYFILFLTTFFLCLTFAPKINNSKNTFLAMHTIAQITYNITDSETNY